MNIFKSLMAEQNAAPSLECTLKDLFLDHFLMGLFWKPKRGATPVILLNLSWEMKIFLIRRVKIIKKWP